LLLEGRLADPAFDEPELDLVDPDDDTARCEARLPPRLEELPADFDGVLPVDFDCPLVGKLVRVDVWFGALPLAMFCRLVKFTLWPFACTVWPLAAARCASVFSFDLLLAFGCAPFRFAAAVLANAALLAALAGKPLLLLVFRFVAAPLASADWFAGS
jgi:hypothetical protein